ncbi:MAG: flavodoxin family protein [Thermoplasmata archaeon]|nr:flavodoxin family protein [Thermoplasmata archaeon]
MRKALIVCGSSRMNGVTDTMCKAAADVLEGLGYTPVIAYATDDIGHCRDCGLCEDGICAIDDAMSPIYAEFSEAELLVLATPIHFSGPSSLIKTVIDRFQPYWFARDMPHPSRMVGLMCAGSDRPEFRHTAGVFRAFAAMLGMEWLGHLEVSGTDKTHEAGVDERVRGFLDGVLGSGSARRSSRTRRRTSSPGCR